LGESPPIDVVRTASQGRTSASVAEQSSCPTRSFSSLSCSRLQDDGVRVHQRRKLPACRMGNLHTQRNGGGPWPWHREGTGSPGSSVDPGAPCSLDSRHSRGECTSHSSDHIQKHPSPVGPRRQRLSFVPTWHLPSSFPKAGRCGLRSKHVLSARSDFAEAARAELTLDRPSALACGPLPRRGVPRGLHRPDMSAAGSSR